MDGYITQILDGYTIGTPTKYAWVTLRGQLVPGKIYSILSGETFVTSATAFLLHGNQYMKCLKATDGYTLNDVVPGYTFSLD